MTFIMRPRDAIEMFSMALALVQSRGDENGIYRINDNFIITFDVPLLGKSNEANCLNILVGDRWVLRAVYPDDGTPPLFIEFHPDAAWKWTIRRKHAELNAASDDD